MERNTQCSEVHRENYNETSQSTIQNSVRPFTIQRYVHNAPRAKSEEETVRSHRERHPEHQIPKRNEELLRKFPEVRE